MKRNMLAVLAGLLLCWAAPAAAQEILLDRFEQAGELVVFQSFDDEEVYYYLADKPRIAVENGRPQFSFMKFVTNEETDTEGGTTGAQGGGIVHFLVEFDVPDDMISRAEQELSRKVPGARIAGPIIYRSGNFALVSTFVENNDTTTRILGLGKAPVMEGHKAAVSILLTTDGATLLWENFKMATPDISLQFEMTVAGYREPFEATLEADWGLVARNQTVAAALSTPVLGLDIQRSMKEMEQNGAIRIMQKGSDEPSERMINTAYGKLVEIIFEQQNNPAVTQTLADDPNLFSNLERAEAFRQSQGGGRNAVGNPPRRGGVGTPGRYSGSGGGGSGGSGGGSGSGERNRSGSSGSGSESGGGSGTESNQRVNEALGENNNDNPPAFALLASYRSKQIKTSGTFRMSFNKYTLENQVFRIDENVGPLYDRYGDDPQIFREVNLDDPVFKQREVIVFLDGQDADDFEDYINYVTVSMRKEHQNGDVTLDELRIDKNNFQEEANNFRLLYGWKGDDNRDEWLRYQYKTNWSFHGGVNKESDWQSQTDFNITVAPPHRYRTVILEGDPDILQDEDVRLTSITFYYDFFGKEMTDTVSMRTKEDDLSKEFVYTHEPGKLDYEYEITWRLRGGKTVSTGRQRTTDEFLFVDELPSGR